MCGQSLGIEPELEDESQFVEVADAAYGEYPRGPHRKFEGGYFAYRRSFSSPARLMRTCIEIEWAEDEGLIFREHSQFQSGRRQVDNSQSGRVHISQTTGLVHLVTSVEGSVRLITLTKMIGGEDVMRGAVLTQIDRAAYYLPAFSPIVLRKLRDFDLDKHRAMVGPIDDSAEEYEFICEELAHTERRVIEAAVRSSEPLASFATAWGEKSVALVSVGRFDAAPRSVGSAPGLLLAERRDAGPPNDRARSRTRDEAGRLSGRFGPVIEPLLKGIGEFTDRIPNVLAVD
jgi:hypothetical protein